MFFMGEETYKAMLAAQGIEYVEVETDYETGLCSRGHISKVEIWPGRPEYYEDAVNDPELLSQEFCPRCDDIDDIIERYDIAVASNSEAKWLTWNIEYFENDVAEEALTSVGFTKETAQLLIKELTENNKNPAGTEATDLDCIEKIEQEMRDKK